MLIVKNSDFTFTFSAEASPSVGESMLTPFRPCQNRSGQSKAGRSEGWVHILA